MITVKVLVLIATTHEPPSTLMPQMIAKFPATKLWSTFVFLGGRMGGRFDRLDMAFSVGRFQRVQILYHLIWALCCSLTPEGPHTLSIRQALLPKPVIDISFEP